MQERIPRASISVRFFGDEDTLAMFALGSTGERAVLMFIQLLVLAKDLRNGGTFASPIEVYAARLGMMPKKARECYAILTRPGVDWLEREEDGFRIRSWEKYNDERRGGRRHGAGRPPKHDESVFKNNQTDYDLNTKEGGKVDSKPCASVSVSVPERERQQNTPTSAGEDSLIEHVSKCVARSMRLPGGLRHEKREPALVAERVAGWRKLGTVVIHGASVPIDDVISRAADRCAESELGGRASGCLNWIDTVIDSSVRGEVWPGEFRESSASRLVAPPKPRVIYQPKGAAQ